ncbi:MAG TPA: hypothetical protein VGM25_05875 [Caulobacteraceae bacterium]
MRAETARAGRSALFAAAIIAAAMLSGCGGGIDFLDQHGFDPPPGRPGPQTGGPAGQHVPGGIDRPAAGG